MDNRTWIDLENRICCAVPKPMINSSPQNGNWRIILLRPHVLAFTNFVPHFHPAKCQFAIKLTSQQLSVFSPFDGLFHLWNQHQGNIYIWWNPESIKWDINLTPSSQNCCSIILVYTGFNWALKWRTSCP